MYTKEEMKAGILAEIEEHGDISFATISKMFGAEGEGDSALTSGKFQNVVYWTGVSETLSIAVQELVSNKIIRTEPVDTFIYLVDGAMLQMPVVTGSGMLRGYKKPHWLPVLLIKGEKWNLRSTT